MATKKRRDALAKSRDESLAERIDTDFLIKAVLKSPAALEKLVAYPGFMEKLAEIRAKKKS